MRHATKKLSLKSITIRVLDGLDLAGARGGVIINGSTGCNNSGSSEPGGATHPPPKNGEGTGCMTSGREAC